MKFIQFSIEPDEKEYFDAFARKRGFHKASDMARFALHQYVTRYPVKSLRAVQPDSLRTDNEEGRA